MKLHGWQKFVLILAACAAGSYALLAGAPNSPDPNNITGTQGLIMVDKLGSRVRFFTPDTYKELSSIDVGTKPHEIAISPDRKTAYVTVYGDGVYGNNPHPGHTIAIIDIASRQMTGTIDVSPYIAPHGLMIDSHGMLYVTCDLSRKLLIIDPQKKSIEAAIDTEGTGHFLAILPDASKAYVANKNDKPFISVIDLKTRKMIGTIPAPNGTQGITASPDGKRVLAVDFATPQLIVIDTATDKVVDTVPLNGAAEEFRVKYSPDGSEIMTTASNAPTANLLKAADLHGQQIVLTVGKTPMGMAFAADGRTALVANHGEGTVSVVDLKEGRVTSKFDAGTGIENAAYY
jgi:DNA-binding beta-propeller fold protein YncE